MSKRDTNICIFQINSLSNLFHRRRRKKNHLLFDLPQGGSVVISGKLWKLALAPASKQLLRPVCLPDFQRQRGQTSVCCVPNNKVSLSSLAEPPSLTLLIIRLVLRGLESPVTLSQRKRAWDAKERFCQRNFLPESSSSPAVFW